MNECNARCLLITFLDAENDASTIGAPRVASNHGHCPSVLPKNYYGKFLNRQLARRYRSRISFHQRRVNPPSTTKLWPVM